MSRIFSLSFLLGVLFGWLVMPFAMGFVSSKAS